ncbi:phosphatases II [Polyplosphaeria fusca]|uniref:Phosphatases II n=1 Tax=Polyplosphaeria fusca TaxID=682080 RepID=A0A9P4QX85_9PLEO|nr:phosphatases II [Polyplosphaeria fusca]
MVSTQEDAMMADLHIPLSHKAHQEYTYRLPTPPRIVVPPPTLTTEMPELSVGYGTDVPEEEVDMSFLKEFDLDSIVQRNTLLEWAYERRRQAQMILPWLWLGPFFAAKDKNFLTREGITMILAIQSKDNSLKGAILAGQNLNLEVGTVDAADSFNLIRNFSRATNTINRHMARIRQTSMRNGSFQSGKILVFCESGNEKSAAIVAAYLMETMSEFDYVKAMQVCQAQRFCVNFDDSIKNLLRSHWDIVSARRMVANSRSTLLESTALKNRIQNVEEELKNSTVQQHKRSIDDTMSDEDTNMDEGLNPTDLLRFTGRDNTPFQDS